METTPSSLAAPLLPAPEPAPSLGGLRQLILFLLAALGLFLLVQAVSVSLILYSAHQQNPKLAWGALVRRVEQRVQYNAFFLVPVQLVYSVVLVGLLYAWVRLRRGLPFWRTLAVQGLAHRNIVPALAGGILLAVLATYASSLLPPPKELPFDKLLSSRAAALLVIAASVLVAPVVEELVFRGYIYTVLERVWGLVPAVLASGLLFGSIHFPQLWPGYVQMALLCLVGVAFSLARARTGNTLASILMHLAYNVTISAFYLASREFQALPAALSVFPQ